MICKFTSIAAFIEVKNDYDMLILRQAKLHCLREKLTDTTFTFYAKA